MIAGGSQVCRSSTTLATLKGFFEKLKTYKLLASMHFYREVIAVTAHLSFKMQKQSCLVTDVIDSIKEGKEKITEFQANDTELPFPAIEQDDGSLQINASSTNLPANQTFKEKMQLTEKQKAKALKFVTIHRESINIKYVHQGKQAIGHIRNQLLPAINDCITERFKSFEEPVFQAMVITDHHRWDFDDHNYGIKEIEVLVDHFTEPLQFHNFNLQASNYEFRQLKKLVRSKYYHMELPTSMWNKIFQQHNDSYPNILLVMEIILCLSCSSSNVERGFSAINRILTSSRVLLGKKHIDDLMMIRINLPTLSQLDPHYEAKLVQKATDHYLQKNRYHKTTSSSSSKSRSEDAANSEDLFLPIKRACIADNMLLVNEDYKSIRNWKVTTYLIQTKIVLMMSYKGISEKLIFYIYIAFLITVLRSIKR